MILPSHISVSFIPLKLLTLVTKIIHLQTNDIDTPEHFSTLFKLRPLQLILKVYAFSLEHYVCVFLLLSLMLLS